MPDHPPSRAVDADRARATAQRAARHRLARRDPFFAELARTRPDVDVVLLPPVEPRPPADPATRDEAAAVADRTVLLARQVGARLGLPAAAATQQWWPVGDRGRHRYVVRARFDLPDDVDGVDGVGDVDAEDRVRALARHLRDDGWVVTATPQPLTVHAARDGAQVRVVLGRDRISVRLGSAVVALDDDVVDALRPDAVTAR